MLKVRDSVDNNKTLFCIGYHLPDIKINENFAKPVYFLKCKFLERTDFDGSIFQSSIDFSESDFYEIATFFIVPSKTKRNSIGPYFTRDQDSMNLTSINLQVSMVLNFNKQTSIIRNSKVT